MNAAELYLARLSPGTVRDVQYSLDVLARVLTKDRDARAATVAWHTLTPADTARLRRALAKRYAPATANKLLAFLRGLLRASFRLGLMTSDDLLRALDMGRVRGSSPPRGRHVQAEEIAALLKACPDTARGRRDAALVQLLYQAGLRRAEAVGLEIGAWDRKGEELRVRWGKGRKFRDVAVSAALAGALARWLEVRGERRGALLTRVSVRDQIPSLQPLTSGAVGVILSILVERSGVEPLTPHDLRRSFVSELLDRGADLVVVQRLVGHAGPGTTSRYDRRGAPARRKAVALLEG